MSARISFASNRRLYVPVRHRTPSRYYMGFWPCQQGTGSDWEPTGVLTDVSGKGAHGTLGGLSDAEAGDNAGWLTSLAVSGDCGQIAGADWTHRFTGASLIIFARQRMVKSAANARRFGNGCSTTATGLSFTCTTSGALQLNPVTPAGASSTINCNAGNPYDSLATHDWMFAFDYVSGTWSFFLDAAITVDAATSLQPYVEGMDAAVTTATGIGGRPAGGNSAAAQTAFVHALSFPGVGLPTNLAVLAARLGAHPFLALRDEDFAWA